MGTVVRVSNHYMVGIVLGILAALVAGAVLAFLVMKHLRKKKKGGRLSSVWTLAGLGEREICDLWKSFNWNIVVVVVVSKDVQVFLCRVDD